MIRTIITAFLLVILAAPNFVFAALASENFSVSNDAIATDFITSIGSSENFSAGPATGGFAEGFLYILSNSDVDDGSGVESTRTDRYLIEDDEERVLANKNTSILVCHDANGRRLSARVNTYVFISILEYGKKTGLGGHELHQYDIVPPFTYDFGDGVFSYEGKNWTDANKKLYANNCADFLAQDPLSVTPQPPTLPTEGFNNNQIDFSAENNFVPFSICDGFSQDELMIIAIDDQTLLRIHFPPGAIQTAEISPSPKFLFANIKSIPNSLFTSRISQFASIVENPKVIQNSDIRYIPPTQKFANLHPTTLDFVSNCSSEANTQSPDTSDFSESIISIPESDGWLKVANKNSPTGELALITTPFSVGALTDSGMPITRFTKPVKVSVFTPISEEIFDSIYITKPSADNQNWFEVPFTIEGDEITFEINSPGEFYIWYVRDTIATDTSYSDAVTFWSFYGIPYALLLIGLFLLGVSFFLFKLLKRRRKNPDNL